ncbi:hypothetical protein PVAND_008280 [Polypedilum vanderplanki]|uniref:Uncharacterized protein n=1 Tax=Polypedilum vanderplanki TaxID=319348 RepID=A0A9J6C9I0_POLVA|nr:hypothetical protein PVAND_008280 [Polypedilum vanderplanki]
MIEVKSTTNEKMKTEKGHLHILEFIIKFMIATKIDSKLIYTIIITTTIRLTAAWWYCFEQKLLSRAKASSYNRKGSTSSSWLLLIIILRVSEICALNHTTMTSTTYHQHATTMLPTLIVKEQLITKSHDSNSVIMDTLIKNNEDYDGEESEEIYDDKLHLNYSANGMIVGSNCEFSCDKRLHHVFCNPLSNKCECEKSYSVILDPRKGCAKPKKLGEQCFYDITCIHTDENSVCMQINHNAICSCKDGHHLVTHLKPTKRTFCTQDLTSIASDLPTLLGVSTGIFVLAGLLCMVLHLFSKTKYPRSRNFADAHAGPPVFFASDTGIPLTIHSNRPSSRSSQRSTGSMGSVRSYNRRSSGFMHKGVNVTQSRQGSARSAAILLYSYHLTQLQNALNDQSSSSSPHNVVSKNIASYSSYFNSNHFMAKYIEQQLEDQKRLLYLEIPALRNHNSLMRKLRLNLRSESDLSQLDTYEHAQHLIGKSPLHKNLHRKLFRRTTTITNDDTISADADERSGVDDLFPNKSTDNVIDLDGSRESRLHYVSERTNATSTDGYSNPLAYSSLNDLDGDNQSESDDSDYEDERRDYQRKYIIDNQEIYIGVLPSPASEGSRRPSLASVHSTTSSIRSYSSRRFEQEIREKELRQEMKKQLCRLQEQQQLQKLRPTIIIGDSIPYSIQTKQSPHIITPSSVDELLPCVEENDEFSPQFDRKNQNP